MALLSASNDPGYYVGDMINLSFVDSPNMMWQIKSMLKTVGWTVTAYGGGTGVPAITGTYSDYFVSATLFYTGASELSNTSRARSWFVITAPSSSRSFCVQYDNSSVASNNWRIKYSMNGFSITGTLTSNAVPGPIIANDEYVTIGGGTDNSPNASTLFETNIRSHMFAQDTSPFGFVFAAYVQSGSTNQLLPRVAWMLDPLVPGTYPGSDPDPYVMYCRYGNTAGNTQPWRWDTLTDFTLGPVSYLSRSFGTSYTITPALMFANDSNVLGVPAGFLSSSYSGKDEVFPLFYARGTSGGVQFAGWRGMSTFLRWNSVLRIGGETISTTSSASKDYLSLGATASLLLWNGTTPTP